MAKNCPTDLFLKLRGLMDAALPDCKCLHTFTVDWMHNGIDVAYARWRQRGVMNTHFLTLIDETIAEIKKHGHS